MCLSKVEVEQALVEAEMESEVAALQQEKDALEALHSKMADLETKSQQEKQKVFSCLCFFIKERNTCHGFIIADTEREPSTTPVGKRTSGHLKCRDH